MVALVVRGGEIGSEWVPVILLSATALFCASVYFLRLREFVLLGQAPALVGLLWAIGSATQTAEFTWPLLFALLVSLGLAHWWRWQGKTLGICGTAGGLARSIALVAEGVFSGGVILAEIV